MGPLPSDTHYASIETIGASSTFIKTPHIVENSSLKYFSSYFNIVESTVPVPQSTSYTASDWVGDSGAYIYAVGKGFLKSFVNKLNIVLKSAVNDRKNTQQGKDFHKKYFVISRDDFDIKKVNSTARSLRNIDLKLFVNSYMYFILNSGKTVQDHLDYCSSENVNKDPNLSIVENVFGNTEIRFSGSNIFEQSFRQDIEYTADGITDKLRFRSLSDNILKRASLVVDIGGHISTFNIISNKYNKVEVKGKHYNSLIKARSFAVLLLDPDEIFFKNDYAQRSVVALRKEAINSDGTISYQKVAYDTNFKSGVEEVGFYERKKKFSLVKSINLFTIGRITE